MMGEVSEDELHAVFTEQARALAEAGADALIFETMSDLAEAKIGVQAARSTGLPVIVSLAFDSGKNLDRTMMGTTPEVAAAELTAAGADVIGANCGQGIEGYASICQRMHDASPLPLWMKPNAGLPELIEGGARYRTAPEAFARHAPALLSAGASFLGGCCGTDPEFIRALAVQIDLARAGKAQHGRVC
jgi:methionine synthase I (cobalamin-dependent)